MAQPPCFLWSACFIKAVLCRAPQVRAATDKGVLREAKAYYTPAGRISSIFYSAAPPRRRTKEQALKTGELPSCSKSKPQGLQNGILVQH
jgi:hypothetical protein